MRRFLVVPVCVGLLLFNALMVPSVAKGYSTGMSASVVIGQKDFVTAVANQGIGTGANTLNSDRYAYVLGQKLFISDGSNNRVLIYNQIPTINNVSADVVLGQADFSGNSANQGGGTTAGANTFSLPQEIASDGVHLVIADATNNRVLIWNQIPTASNTPADVVVGQASFSSTTANQGGSIRAFTLSNPVGANIINGKLVVTDLGNNRVLIYNSIPIANNASADVVIGQADFTHGSANQGLGTPGANTLGSPRVTETDGQKLFVPETANNRVLIFNQIPTTNNVSADIVVGQADFTHGSANQGGSVAANTLNQPNSARVDNGRLYVNDTNNARVLIYNRIPTSNNAQADIVIGQTDFVSSGIGVTASTLNASRDVFPVGNGKLIVTDGGNGRALIFNNVLVTPFINITTPPVSLGNSRYRIVGNVFLNKNSDAYALQSLLADLNGVGNSNISFSGGRDDGAGNTVFDFNYDFDPTVGSGSINNLVIKFTASTFNTDTNSLFYFLPFKFTSFNVSSTKSQSFTFSVNKDQLQRVKDNLDHFEVWYKKNTTTSTWTRYISNIPDTQIDQNGLVVATKTTNLTKFIGSYIFKVVAVDNWNNRQDSNYLYTAGTIFPTRIASFTRNFLPIPTPTMAPIPVTGTAIPTYFPTPYVVPTQMPVESQNTQENKLKLYLVILGAVASAIAISFIIWKRRKKE